VKDFEGSGYDLIITQSRHFPGEADENHEKRARVAGVLDKIGSEPLPNTTLERYLYTSPFDINSVVTRISDCLILNIV
jgi:hypothetical protein